MAPSDYDAIIAEGFRKLAEAAATQQPIAAAPSSGAAASGGTIVPMTQSSNGGGNGGGSQAEKLAWAVGAMRLGILRMLARGFSSFQVNAAQLQARAREDPGPAPAQEGGKDEEDEEDKEEQAGEGGGEAKEEGGDAAAAAAQAQRHIAVLKEEFAALEERYTEQVDVVDKLTAEKQKLAAELQEARQLIQSLKRQNATMAAAALHAQG